MALVKDLIDVSDDDEDVVCLDDHSSGDDSVVCLDDLDGGHRRPELTVLEIQSENHSKKYADNSKDHSLNMTSYHHHETIKPKIELSECEQWPSVVSTSLDNYDPQFTEGPSMVSQYITLSSNGQTAEPDWVDLPFVVRAVDSAADNLDHQVADDDALASLEDRLKQLKRERARAYYQTRKAMKPLTAEQKEAREKLREKKLAYRKEKKKKVQPKPKRPGSEGKGGPSKRRERPPKVTTSH